eukprot:scaffold71897_cov31-Tisochrysis_lutea.AAC.2
MIDVGVCSAGFKTTQLPAARAGASFHVAISSGTAREGRNDVGIKHRAIAGTEGAHLPPATRLTIPWDDLANDAKRLLDAHREGVRIDLGGRTLLGTNDSSKVTPVINHQWQVCCKALP